MSQRPEALERSDPRREPERGEVAQSLGAETPGVVRPNDATRIHLEGEVFPFGESAAVGIADRSDLPPISTSVQEAIKDVPADQSVTAAFLVRAILQLHGGDYADGRGREFLVSPEPSDATARPVGDWLRAVRDVYAPVVPRIDGRLLILGLSLVDPSLVPSLSANGFLAALQSEIVGQEVPDTHTRVGSIAEILSPSGQQRWRTLAAQVERLPNHRDLPAEIDELNRLSFAAALATRIRTVQADQQGPFVVHLDGAWGSGKTSLLHFVRDNLRRSDETNPWVVIEFNAWQHQRSGSPWWWLMNSVYQQSRQQLGATSPWRSRWLFLSEQAWRARVGWAPYLVGIVLLLLGGWLLSVSGLLDQLSQTITKTSDKPPWDALRDLLESVIAILGVLTTVYFTTVGLGRLALTGSSRPVQTLLFARDPMTSLSDHFGDVIRRIGWPVAILVDDLDRCQSGYVVELLEGVQTIFSQATVTYVIAADRHWLRASFEKVYDGYTTVGEPGRPLGYLFLDKMFQLSAPLPALPSEVQAEYWDRLLTRSAPTHENGDGRAKAKADALLQRVSNGADARAILKSESDGAVRRIFARQAVQKLATPTGVAQTEHMLRPFAALLEPNPRAMKRLVNAYGVREASDLLAGGMADPKQLALWSILSVRWPLLAEYLETHPEAVEYFGGEAAPDDAQIPESLRLLGHEAAVRRVIRGDAVGAFLDADAIHRCLGQRLPSSNDRHG